MSTGTGVPLKLRILLCHKFGLRGPELAGQEVLAELIRRLGRQP